MSKFPIQTIGEAARELDSGEGMDGYSEIQNSLCMNCQASGTTRMLTTKIPFFREIIICSFDCPECYWSNNEVIFGGELQEKGCNLALTVKEKEDLNRQIIKSEHASVLIKEIEFEMPPHERGGEVSTIEGLLKEAAEKLGYEQAHRMEVSPEVGVAVAEVICKLVAMAEGETLPFTVVVDDPTGNSFIENPQAPNPDKALHTKMYQRTAAQNAQIGLQPAEQPAGGDDSSAQQVPKGSITTDGAKKLKLLSGAAAAVGSSSSGEGQQELAEDDVDFMHKESMAFQTPCSNCSKPGETLMCMVDIPHFKEVIVMSFDCALCGYRSNEVKGGGAVPPLGTEYILTVKDANDFKRDVLKSDAAMVAIPELELELAHGSLGGLYTTLEGLLEKVRDTLVSGNPFFVGDSATNHHSSKTTQEGKFGQFLRRLSDVVEQRFFPFHLVIRDPLGNSFIGSLEHSDPEDDENIKVTHYERSEDENEIMGLLDMKTEGYEVVPDSYRQAPGQLPHMLPHRVGTDHPVNFTKGTSESDDTKASDAGKS